MSLAKKRVLATPQGDMFLERDIEILKNHFDIRTAPGFSRRRPVTSVLGILKGAWWADLTLSQFAGTHAFLAVLFSKIFGNKSVVIVGGYEVADVPEIGYGSMSSPWYAPVVKFVLNQADRVLTVAESLKQDAIFNAGVSGENIKTIPECYDPEFWKCEGVKEEMVLTVAHIKAVTVKRKGLQTFVEAARHLPNAKFVLIGPHLDNSVDYLKSIAPPNVEFPGLIPSEELPRWYSRAKVYCQLSRYEGIPNALCEAMLCECVPVGTEYCGIPAAIGDAGFYVPYGDVKATVEAIEQALASDKGKKARDRIKRLFPLWRRKKELVEELKGLLRSEASD